MSKERITAGAVVRLDDGQCFARVAVTEAAVTHAFGIAGQELYHAAFHLCQSLLEHVQAGGAFKTWTPPFAGAEIGNLGRAEARNMDAILDLGLAQNSMLYTLLSHYAMPAHHNNDSLASKVKSAISKNKATKHLKERFYREIMVREEAMPLKVEFLGANFACYFLQLSKSQQGIEISTSNACGKLFKLQNLKQHFEKLDRPTVFDEERPQSFELLVVADDSDRLQKSALLQIESFADANKLIARVLPDAQSAASMVVKRESLAA